MGEDDEATVSTLRAYREVMGVLIHKHRGHPVHGSGDSLLAEFISVVDSVRCAVEIQKELKTRNAELPENRKIEFRIGINLGDVIEEGDDLHGDGVNIAARVEALAEGGGICITRTVYDQVKNKLSLGYKSLGEHSVKNIAEPVRVYRVLIEPETASKVTGKEEPKPRRWPRIAIAAGVILIIIAGALGIWKFYFRRPSVQLVSLDDKAHPLTDNPSIAVLPFSNLSGDPDQEYFSDGITNDIITDLSKFRELFVIASNTAFSFKGKSIKIIDIGKELNVRYVLEGSIQKTGEKIRVNAQLIDATTGHHLWAERYDRDLEDLFVLQNELVQTIVAKMAIQIDKAESIRVIRKDTDNLKAYDYLLRGWKHYYQYTRENNKKARIMFQRATEIDPLYSSAYGALALSYLNDFHYGWTMFPNKSLQQAHDFAKKALSLEESNALAHSVLGSFYLRRKQYDLAISELQRSIELNPNYSRSKNSLGSVLLYSGRTDEAIYWIESALRLNPRISMGSFMTLGQAYYLSGRYEDAIMILKKGLARRPDFVGNYIVLAAAYAKAGFTEEAKHTGTKVLRLHPFFEIDSYGSVFRNPEDRSKFVDGLRKAGLN
jgi:adenylate cyclase